MADRTWSATGLAPGLDYYVKRNGERVFRLRRRNNDGKQVSIPIEATNDAQAAAKAWAIIAGVSEETVASPTLREQLDFLLDRAVTRKGNALAVSTREMYRDAILNHGGEVLDLPMTRVGAEHAREWAHQLRSKGYAPNTIYRVAVAIRKAFSTAIDYTSQTGVTANPFAGTVQVDRRNVRETREVSREQIQQVADRADRQTRAMILTAAATGWRSAELRGCRWQDVDLARGTYRLAVQEDRRGGLVERLKTTNSGKGTPLIASAREVLAEWKAESGNTSGLVFRAETGAPVDRSNARRALHRACDAAGVERFGWHALRHAFVGLLAGNNVGPQDLSAYARDGLGTVERHYTRNVGIEERAAEVRI